MGLAGQNSNLQNLLKQKEETPQTRHILPRHHQPRQQQNRLTKSQIDELIQAYQAGSKINELAERFNIHRTTVMEHLDRQGVVRRQQGLTASQIQEAARLYTKGWSLARLGERFGIDAKTVRSAIAERGVPIRPRLGRPRGI